ncbi:MAG: hypothetical protein ACXWJB_05410, partial [Limisphaerales bacterium]
MESETRGQHNHDHFYYSFPNWVGLVLLAVLTLIIFGHILVAPNGSVISAFGYDLSGEFVYWREFGFRQLRSGNIPLWNPHALCGVPFFGSFQSALLYPPNALFLLLPLNAAINWSVALHVYLAGVFTFLWTKNRGLHPLACLLSSIMFMFGAPYFLHIFAGHLSNLCTMVWTPLVFLAVDKLLIRPSLAGCLLGIFAASMSILAGHVQYVFYTAVVAALYCLLDFTRRRPSARVILYLLAIGVGAIALTAIQSFTGLQEGAERLRSQGTSYDFSSMFSFPPENFLTVLAPWFFGDMKTSPYWGRCYLTEMSLFISVTGLVLAIYGAIRGAPATRRFAVTLTVVTLILALGAHTPIFNVLYHYVPGFSMFRGMSKFVFAASLFIALLAGIGLDVLLKGGRVPRPLLFGTLVLGIAACGTTFWLSHATMNAAVDSWWPTMIRSVQQTGEIFMQSTATSATFDDPAFPTQAGGIACKSLLAGGATLLVVSIALFLTNRSRRWAIAFVVLVSVELLIFASTSLETFMLARCKYPRVLEVASQNQGDYRILNLDNPNSSLVHGTFDIWGDDPGILKRYGEFLGFSQGIASQDVRQFIPITNASPIFAMLRARFIFPREAHGADYSELKNQALPHVLLVSRYRVMTNRTEILSCLTNAAFN